MSLRIIVVSGSRYATEHHRQMVADGIISAAGGVDFKIYVGDCKGVDSLASTSFSVSRTVKADWVQGRSAGPMRNTAMLEAAIESAGVENVVLAAFPLTGKKNLGTISAIRIAAGLGVPLNVTLLPVLCTCGQPLTRNPFLCASCLPKKVSCIKCGQYYPCECVKKSERLAAKEKARKKRE